MLSYLLVPEAGAKTSNVVLVVQVVVLLRTCMGIIGPSWVPKAKDDTWGQRQFIDMKDC